MTRISDIPGITDFQVQRLEFLGATTAQQAKALLRWEKLADRPLKQMTRGEARGVLIATHNQLMKNRGNPEMIGVALDVAYGVLQTLLRHENFMAAARDKTIGAAIEAKLYAGPYVGLYRLLEDTKRYFKLGGDK